MTEMTLQVVYHTLLCSLILMSYCWCLSDYVLVHHRACNTRGETIVKIIKISTQPEQLWDYHTATPPPPPQTRPWQTWVCHRSSPQPGDQGGYHMFALPHPLSCVSYGHSFCSVYTQGQPPCQQIVNYQFKGPLIQKLTWHLLSHKTVLKGFKNILCFEWRQINLKY